MNPEQVINDSFDSAIAALDNPEKKTTPADFLDTFRGKDGASAGSDYLNKTRGYVLSALDKDAIAAADSRTKEFEATIAEVLDPKTNLVVLTQVGLAPYRTRMGGHGEKLHFQDYPSQLDRQIFLAQNSAAGQTYYYSSSKVSVAGEPVRASVGYQARTRGGRDMDAILASHTHM